MQPEEQRELLMRVLKVVAVSNNHGRLAVHGRRFPQHIAADYDPSDLSANGGTGHLLDHQCECPICGG
jgi:hypothetical protein